MDPALLIPSFLILSLAGTTLSLTIYTTMNKKSVWILSVAIIFLISFFVAITLAWTSIEGLIDLYHIFMILNIAAVILLSFFIGNDIYQQLLISVKTKKEKIKPEMAKQKEENQKESLTILTHNIEETDSGLTINRIKNYVKKEDYVSFSEAIDYQLNVIEKVFFEIYEKATEEETTEENIRKTFQELEKYTILLSVIGILLIKYYPVHLNSNYSTHFYDTYLEIFPKLYEIPEKLKNELKSKNIKNYDKKIGNLPRIAMNNIFYIIGAYDLKNSNNSTQRLDMINRILKLEIYVTEPSNEKKLIYSLLQYNTLISQVDDLDLLTRSYDKDDNEFLKIFFNTHNEFLKGICYFNFLICLYNEKIKADVTNVNPQIWPYFSFMSQETKFDSFLFKLSNPPLLITVSEKIFEEEIPTFKKKYVKRCGKINENIDNNLRNTAKWEDSELLRCDIFKDDS